MAGRCLPHAAFGGWSSAPRALHTRHPQGWQEGPVLHCEAAGLQGTSQESSSTHWKPRLPHSTQGVKHLYGHRSGRREETHRGFNTLLQAGAGMLHPSEQAVSQDHDGGCWPCADCPPLAPQKTPPFHCGTNWLFVRATA